MSTAASSPRSRPRRDRGAGPVPAGAGPRRIWPGLILGAIGAGAAGVIALWWVSTPAVTDLGGALTGAGRVLGLLAGYGVVMLVALMARLPPLEHSIGAGRLGRWHAQGGHYVIFLIAAHAVTITWGYAISAREGVVQEAGTLLTSYPDVLMATVAAGLLLAVGLISARAVRRRMAYETWYYLHLYTYLAIALAFSHQFADGISFAGRPPARAAWSARYAAVAALVVWYRIITPVRTLRRHRFRVAGVRPEAPGVVSVYITGNHLDELRAAPGQFFRWRFLARGLWWQSHPYSLSAMPRPGIMRITVKARGDHGHALARLRPGIRISAEGPYGAFTPAPSRRGVVLLAGGVGITPIRAMFAAMPGGTGRVSGGITLIYRASHARDVVFREELDHIAAARGATVHYLLGSRHQLGTDPLSAAHLRALVPGLHRQEAYICGPPDMTGAAVSALRTAGVPRRRIHYESFGF